jgi:hypothetical protein
MIVTLSALELAVKRERKVRSPWLQRRRTARRRGKDARLRRAGRDMEPPDFRFGE